MDFDKNITCVQGCIRIRVFLHTYPICQRLAVGGNAGRMWRPILVLSNGLLLLLLLLINRFVQRFNAGPTNYSRVDPERTYERKRSYMVTPAVKFVDRWKKKKYKCLKRGSTVRRGQ